MVHTPTCLLKIVPLTCLYQVIATALLSASEDFGFYKLLKDCDMIEL